MAIHFIPSERYIWRLKPGDFALDSFGNLSEITSITSKGRSLDGKIYVCYRTKLSPGSTCSMSMRSDELVRTVSLTGFYNTYWDLLDAEKDMKNTSKGV